ncbi:MAG: gliding motility-associated C-terminal domain-containing protein [Bacteroidales bacterium]|nr:gliding motility-associated C-terminal domain-containing protein [Bacteroidales bacterium]
MKSRIVNVIFLFFVLTNVFGEGTREIMPDSTQQGYLNLAIKANVSIGSIMNCAEFQRIYIHISNPAVEKICLGFLPKSSDYYFRILKPDGSLLVSGTNLPLSGQGYIPYYKDVYNGPDLINPNGYDALTYTPTVAGDYWIEFNCGDNFITPIDVNSGSYFFKIFDISVVDISANTERKGRVFCKSWNIGNASYSMQGSYYTYTTDSVISRITFPSGFNGINWILNFNSFGCTKKLSVSENQKSVDYDASTKDTVAEYKVFINFPDTTIYRPAQNPLKINFSYKELICGSKNSTCIKVNTNRVVTIDVFLNLNNIPGYQPNTADTIISYLCQKGDNCIPWNRLDGDGKYVSYGRDFDLITTCRIGINHLPVWDVEDNTGGIFAEILLPKSVASIPKLYWDDSNISGGVANITGMNPPAHSWPSANWGNNRTINTWFYCTVYDSVHVRIPDSLTVSSTKKDANCYGYNNGNTAITVQGGDKPYNYLWDTSPVNTTSALNNLPAGTYICTVTDLNGCEIIDTIIINQPLPSVKVDSSLKTICKGESALFSASPLNTYSWSNGLSTPNITVSPSVTTTYFLSGTDAAGCTGITSCIVIVNPDVKLNVSSTPTNCFNDGTATVNVISGTAPYTYIWDATPMQFTQTATKLNSGTYTVSVTDNNGCNGNIKIVVGENNPLLLTSASTPENCGHNDGTAEVFASGGINDYHYLWSTNDTFPEINNLPQGQYWVTVTQGTCKKTIKVNVNEKPGPVAGFEYSPDNVDVMNNSTVTFEDLSTQGGQVISRWSWDFGDNTVSESQSPVHTYDAVGNYNVCLKITDAANCVDSVCKPLKVKDIFTVYIPNAFSPNSDMLNEGFIPQGYNIDPNDFLMIIFNRWGEEIYKTTDINAPWNGRYMNSGGEVQPGVYVYKVIVKEKEGSEHMFMGSVCVIR